DPAPAAVILPDPSLDQVVLIDLDIGEVLVRSGGGATEALVVTRLHDVVQEERYALGLVVVGERRDAEVGPAPRVDLTRVEDGLAVDVDQTHLLLGPAVEEVVPLVLRVLVQVGVIAVLERDLEVAGNLAAPLRGLAVVLGLLDRLFDLLDQRLVPLGDQRAGAEHPVLVRQERERQPHRLLSYYLRHQASPSSVIDAKSAFASWIASAAGRVSLSGARDRRPSLLTSRSPRTCWSSSADP